MSRSKLHGWLNRHAHLALAAEREGWSTAEALARAEAVRLSRRQFLGATAAAGLIPLACGGDDGPPAPKPDVRVGVIGGGMAGLHAAYRLKKGGVLATVYEASNRVGGRMFTARGMYPDGQVAELGGELIDTGHEVMQALAAELELELDDLYANEPANFARDTYYFEGARVTETQLIDLFRPVATKMAEAVAAAEAEGDAGAAEFERLDALSIAEWLAGEGQADPLLAKILELTYTGEYGLQAEEQSIFNLLYLIDYDAPDPFHLYGDSDERFHTHSGSDSFPTKLAEALSSQVQLDTLLEKVERLADGRYKCSFQRGSGAFEDTVDHLILALPFTKLREVDLTAAGISTEKQEVIDQLGYGTNAKLMGGFSSQVWRTQHNASGASYSDLGIQTTWDTARGQPGTAGLITVFLGGVAGLMSDQGTPESRYQAALPHLETLWPGTQAAYQANSALRMHWPTAPFAKGSYACYRPGQWAYYGLEGERQDNLHFCGEHTSLDFQGYMEGAAESGAKVAAEVLSDLGLASGQALRAALGPRRQASQLRLRRQARRRLLRRLRAGR